MYRRSHQTTGLGRQYLEEGLLKLGLRGRKNLTAWLCHMELKENGFGRDLNPTEPQCSLLKGGFSLCNRGLVLIFDIHYQIENSHSGYYVGKRLGV